MRGIVIATLAVVVIGGLFVLGIASLDFSGGSPAIAESNARATLSAAEAGRLSTRDAARVVEVEREKIIAEATISAAEIASRATLSAEVSQATSTAVYKSTAAGLDLRSTAVALSVIETKSASDIQATATIRDFEIREKELEIERASMTNRLRAFFGYAVSTAVVLAILYIVYSLVRVRIVKKGSVVLSGKRMIDPALSHSAVTDISQAAGVPSEAVSSRIKERDQVIEAVKAMNPNDRSRATAAAGLLSGMNSPIVEIVDSGSVSEWVDEVNARLLEDGS